MLTLIHLPRYLHNNKIYDIKSKYIVNYINGNIKICSSRKISMDSFSEIRYKVYNQPYQYIRFIIRLGLSDIILKGIYYEEYKNMPSVYYYVSIESLLSYLFRVKKYHQQMYMHYKGCEQ